MTTALGSRPAPSRRRLGLAPFISVLVPVRNEERFIEATLSQLLEQDYPMGRYEILVADGRSDDSTREIVKRIAADHPEVRLIDNPGRLSSAGRNAAVRASRGELLVLIDGHCEVRNPSYLSQLAEAFDSSKADTIGRPQPLDVPSASPLQRAIAAGRESRFGHHPGSSIWAEADGFVAPQSVAVAYRREVFDRVGFFDERFDACEDYEFNTRCAAAGLTCWLSTAATVRYHPRASLAGLYRQMERYGRGRVRLLRKHPASFSPTVFVPALFVVGLLLGPLFALALPMLWWAYFGCVGAYAAGSLLFSAAVSMKHRAAWMLPILPAVFAAVHLGAGVGVLKELLFGHPEGRK